LSPARGLRLRWTQAHSPKLALSFKFKLHQRLLASALAATVLKLPLLVRHRRFPLFFGFAGHLRLKHHHYHCDLHFNVCVAFIMIAFPT
jgi:hypothetical protein